MLWKCQWLCIDVPGGGSVLCSEYALITARPCVTLSSPRWRSGLRMSSFAFPDPRNRGGLLLFPSISFIALHQCPKGTRFYCPALELLEDGEKDLGGALCFSCSGHRSHPSVLPCEGAFSESSACLVLSLSEYQFSGRNKPVCTGPPLVAQW